MTYLNEADLADDVEFNRRVKSCITEEAKAKTDSFSQSVMTNPALSVTYFMPFLSTAPGFGDSYAEGGSESIDDGAVLSAVQANWDAVAALYPEEEEVPAE